MERAVRLPVLGWAKLGGLALLLVLGGWHGVCAQQGSPAAAAGLPGAPSSLPGTVSGTVVDADGDVVEGATVKLLVAGAATPLKMLTDDDGVFVFNAVPPGAFTVTASSEGVQDVSVTGQLRPADATDVGTIALRTATAQFEVSAMSPHDAAQIDVKQEESQRLLGILPNFGITYNWNAPRLDAKQKFELATRSVIDPTTFLANAGIAGGERYVGEFQEFGPGWLGFWKLYGAITADTAIGTELGGAILPTVLHQDPRYFWKGTGTIRSRVLYALSRAIICRGDDGHNQFSYSGVIGDFAAGAISNLYYPKVDRNGASLTFQNGAIDLGYDALGNVIQEFLFKDLTPGSRKTKSNAPGSD